MTDDINNRWLSTVTKEYIFFPLLSSISMSHYWVTAKVFIYLLDMWSNFFFINNTNRGLSFFCCCGFACKREDGFQRINVSSLETELIDVQNQSRDIRTRYMYVCVKGRDRKRGRKYEQVLQSPILEHSLRIMVSTEAFEFFIHQTRSLD